MEESQRLQAPVERVYSNVARYGNTSSASLLIAASEWSEDNPPPGLQAASAGGACGSITPSYAGHYALAVTIKYNFKPLTPFGSQFFPTGIVMTVTSTMSTEY